jgi:hypothetical protein
MSEFITILKIGALVTVVAILGGLVLFLREFQENFQERGPLDEASIEKILEDNEQIGFEAGQYEFNQALESIALGEIDKAREMLHLIENLYPDSTHAPEARRILGEMNLDEILSVENMSNKRIHQVAPGEGYLRIATGNQTTLDAIMFLNGLTGFNDLHTGDELIVMPLDFKLVVDLPRERIELYHRDQEKKEHVFAREYRILKSSLQIRGGPYQVKVSGKNGEDAGSVFPPSHPGYRHAEKVLGIKVGRSLIQLRSLPEEGEELPRRSLFLKRSDMEELAMLIRVGNEVEFRPAQ